MSYDEQIAELTRLKADVTRRLAAQPRDQVVVQAFESLVEKLGITTHDEGKSQAEFHVGYIYGTEIAILLALEFPREAQLIASSYASYVHGGESYGMHLAIARALAHTIRELVEEMDEVS